MANVPSLRHFKKGISHVQQWTGKEHKEMQKVFVALVAGAVSPNVLTVVQALIDFIYYAQLQLHTPKTIEALSNSLRTFHRHKSIFQDLHIREHFNIAKIHTLVHYSESILEKGVLDSYNTELSERLHIDFAKAGYRAGNRHDYIAQITVWLRRREAIRDRFAFLEWLSTLDRWTAPISTSTHTRNKDESEDEGEDVRFAPSITARSYRLTKTCPFRQVTLQSMERNYGASEFATTLQVYVARHFPNSSFLSAPSSTYNVYKQLKIEQPWSPFVSGDIHLEKVQAIAPMT